MNASFMKWFLAGALLVGSMHVGETYRLLFQPPSVEPELMFVVTPIENAAESRT